MSSIVSTITSKWQVTIPEDVRKELPFKVGQRIAWEVEGDRLVGRKVRSIRELAGSLRSQTDSGGSEAGLGEVAKAAMARHDRLTKPRQ